jgi:hypothetical protein
MPTDHEEATRAPRRRRLAWAAVLAVVAVALFLCYLRQSRTQPANSDGAGMALQGWDMLHGNLLLSGWWTADVSFYTFEIPVDAVVEAVRGLNADVVHVTAAVVYTALVIVVALTARGTARGREGAVRAVLGAGVMAAPGLSFEPTRVLLGSPDHVGVGVPILLAMLVVGRTRERRWVPAVVCLLLVWAQLDDPVAAFAAAAPAAVVCLTRAGTRLARHRATGWRYDAALGVAAALSYALTQIAVGAISAAGGYSMRALSQATTAVPVSQWGGQLLHTGQNLLLLFGADFYDQHGGLQTAIAVVHLAGAALALCGLLAGVAALTRSADRVTQILTVGTILTLAAGAFATPMPVGYGAHDIAIALPFSAVLAGRAAGSWLARLPRPAGLTLAPLLGGALACYLAALGYAAAQPPVPAPTQALAGWLAARHLTSGIGQYWTANLTTLASGGQVRVAPVSSPAGRTAYPWVARPEWYDPAVSSANFVIAGTNSQDSTTLRASDVRRAYGPPARQFRYGQYIIMVYDRNLLREIPRPVQPHPDRGIRL